MFGPFVTHHLKSITDLKLYMYKYVQGTDVFFHYDLVQGHFKLILESSIKVTVSYKFRLTNRT